MVRRQGAVLLAAVVATLAGAAPASAWWAEGTSFRTGAIGQVTVTALPGERNDLTAIGVPSGRPMGIPGPAGSVILHDASATVTPPPEGRGEGCTVIDAHTLSCVGIGPFGGPPGVDWLSVDLGDGDDRLRVPAASSTLFLLGDAGSGDDDVATYDLGGASFTGGDGNDHVTIRGNQSGYLPGDAVRGGAGDDVLDLVNLENNYPSCGDGQDTLYADGEDTALAGDCEDVQTVTPAVPPATSRRG
jgi:hypothetical protein